MAAKDTTDESNIVVEVLPPETVEDFIALALAKGGLDEVIKSLRKIHSAKEIRSSLSKLQHRDPVNEILHVRIVALDIYAKAHDQTTSSLMVKLEGINGRSDPERTERGRLHNAKQAVLNDGNLRTAAKALAEKWLSESKGKDPIKYIKSVKPLTQVPPEFNSYG